MEGKINFTQNDDQSGKRPHFKGYIAIGDEVHEFAVWPAKNGNGWSGTYKPKGQRNDQPRDVPEEAKKVLGSLYDDSDTIPFMWNRD